MDTVDNNLSSNCIKTGCELNAVYTACDVAGYIGSVGLLQVIKRVVETLRQSNPDLVYVCDPVLGDDGKLYLPAEMVDLYKSDILHLASIITPNQFEAEQLTGSKISTEQEALQACQYLLKQGPQAVVSGSKLRIPSSIASFAHWFGHLYIASLS